MKIFGGELSQEQIEAGLSVMRGEFDGHKVMMALKNAGVVNIVPGTDRLIARELKSGKITKVTRGIFRQL